MTFDLIMEALRASGVTNQDERDRWVGRLDEILETVRPAAERFSDPVGEAETVFHRLWELTPQRYRPGAEFRLHKVIEAQLRQPPAVVGNCLGLTLLFNGLMKRLGIEVRAVHLESAFGLGPHVLSLLKAGDRWMEVENIRPDGFDFRGGESCSGRTVWRDPELAADVYNSMGTALWNEGRLHEALYHYTEALRYNPTYEKARLNLLMLEETMKGGSEAAE